MFLTDVGLVPLLASNGETVQDLWYLDQPLVWSEPGVTVVAPQGFITDDASIPKSLDWITPLDRQGASRRPGLLHDAIYSLGRERGKAWADDCLRRMCLAEGMSKVGAELIYLGVHWFGDEAWESDAEAAAQIDREGSFVTKAAYDAWVKLGKKVFFE